MARLRTRRPVVQLALSGSLLAALCSSRRLVGASARDLEIYRLPSGRLIHSVRISAEPSRPWLVSSFRSLARSRAVVWSDDRVLLVDAHTGEEKVVVAKRHSIGTVPNPRITGAVINGNHLLWVETHEGKLREARSVVRILSLR